MQATLPGANRTGTSAAPEGAQAMADAVADRMPVVPADTSSIEAERLLYIHASDAVGSVPPALGLGGMVKSGMARLKGANPGVLMDKVGERLAFERGGVRLYEALLAKYHATLDDAGDVLPPAGEVQELVAAEGRTVLWLVEGETPEQTLLRIRSEELAHFQLLCEAMVQLGGDPTAQTPCADVVGTQNMGVVQVLADPRTTLAQCLNAMLTIELTDNAGWELLAQLAEQAGESELAGSFLGALAQEQEHLATIKEWLAALLTRNAGTTAV